MSAPIAEEKPPCLLDETPLWSLALRRASQVGVEPIAIVQRQGDRVYTKMGSVASVHGREPRDNEIHDPFGVNAVADQPQFVCAERMPFFFFFLQAHPRNHKIGCT